MALVAFHKEKKRGNCMKCKLHTTCKTQNAPVAGEGGRKVLIIGEMVDKHADETGELLCGDGDALLRKTMRQFDMDLDEDCWKTNAVCCRPPQGRDPTKSEIVCCRPNIEATIEKLKPTHIFLFGNAAITSLFGMRPEDDSVTLYRRSCIPDHRFNTWVLPMYHPNYVLRKEKDRHLKMVFESDLKYAISCVDYNEEIEPIDYSSVKISTNFDEVMSFMEDIYSKADETVLDWETNMLKPQHKNARIITSSWTWKKGTLSYPVDLKQNGDFFWNAKQRKQLKEITVDIMNEEDLKKIAHNLKFEVAWSDWYLGSNTRGLHWCTMNNAHILDSRRQFTGLKTQVFFKWGAEDYAAETKAYFQEGSPGYQENKLEQMPLKKLLLYGGKDTYWTYKLYVDQQREFRVNSKKPIEDLNSCRNLFTRGVGALADCQNRGILLDKEYFAETDKTLRKKLAELKESILASDEAKLYRKKEGIELDFSSSDTLRLLFFEHLGLTPTKTTTSGDDSMDKEVLAGFDTDLARDIMEWRKLDKVCGTYISSFSREMLDDGYMYPYFDLNTTVTGRSSSSMPNFQNVPVRDEVAKAAIRKGVIPPKGYRIFEVDYGSIEVRIGACYTKDPKLIAYINDPVTDMHRDTASGLFRLNMETKDEMKLIKDGGRIRFFAKNCFVFPEFYGSYWANCAAALADNCFGLFVSDTITVRDWVKTQFDKVKVTKSWLQGMFGKNYHKSKHAHRCEEDPVFATFIEGVKEYEKDYWDKFCVFKEWQERVKAEYLRYGYTKSFFGFRRHGLLSVNDVINSPIQGTAFHCLLWSFIELNEVCKKEKWLSTPRGQIHECIFGYLHPEEQDYVLKKINYVMTEKIREEHDWIIVPLAVEPELTLVGEPWYYKKEVTLPK